MSMTYDEISDTFGALRKTRTYLDDKWGEIVAFLKGGSRFVFVGCGSSYSIAKSFAAICVIGAGKHAVAVTAGDIILHSGRYKKAVDGAAVVFISRSGRTSELLMALDALESQGCDITVASIISADDTPLGARSSLVLSTPWAFDESVCQTRCVTNFYFTAAYIYAKLSCDKSCAADSGCDEDSGCDGDPGCDEEPGCAGEPGCDGGTPLMEDLLALLADGDEYLARTQVLAEEIAGHSWTHTVVLADAELEGLAEEGSLVFKEVCQTPSNYYHLLDSRHGPIVMIGDKTLILAVVGGSNKLEFDLLRDMEKKGAQVVAFLSGADSEFGCEADSGPGCGAGSGADSGPGSGADCGPGCGPGSGADSGPGNLGDITQTGYGRPLSHIAAGIPFIILCQLIAYYKSNATGADPDKPDGLDAWIAL